MTNIDRQQLRQMMHQQAVTVVEVLDKQQYDEFHIPGAINVPLSGDFASEFKRAVLDKSEPVAVYCMDEKCDASPKAAKKMEELGSQRVYDYEAGKVDWKQADLPTES